MRITDCKEEFVVDLNEPMLGIYIPKMVWKEMYGFSADSVLLVLSNAHYDKDEYIRDFEEFKKMVNP